jgi:hypothetical protein
VLRKGHRQYCDVTVVCGLADHERDALGSLARELGGGLLELVGEGQCGQRSSWREVLVPTQFADGLDAEDAGKGRLS